MILSADLWESISSFLDLVTLYKSFQLISKFHLSIGYMFQEQRTQMERRKMILMKKPVFSKVFHLDFSASNHLVKSSWEKMMSIYTMDDDKKKEMSKLVKDILRLPFGFFLGGSRAMIMASLLLDIDIRLNKYEYKDSDFDIYCIGKKDEYDIGCMQKRLWQVISECKLPYYINVKKHLLNIVFPNDKIPSIQIILHIKSSLDEFMEFVDLPNTQFSFFLDDKDKSRLYYTKNAVFALKHGINILYDPIFLEKSTTTNRIKKYDNRGFLTIVASPYGEERKNNQRIVSIFDKGEGSYISRIYVDCFLKDIFQLKSYLDENKNMNGDKEQYFDGLYYHISNINTQVSSLLKFMKIAIYRVTLTKDEYILAHPFSYQSIYTWTLSTSYIHKKYHKLRYYDNERSQKHTYESYHELRRKNFKNMHIFPYYCILKSPELLRFNTLDLFYFDFTTPFLEKNGIFDLKLNLIY